MVFTGKNCQPLGALPIQRDLFPGSSTMMTLSTAANGNQPYALFATFGAAGVSGPGIPTPFGVVDFDPLAIASLSVIIDGIAGVRPVDILLGDTGPTGSRELAFTVPPGTGVWSTFQRMGLAEDDGSCTLRGSSAFFVDKEIE